LTKVILTYSSEIYSHRKEVRSRKSLDNDTYEVREARAACSRQARTS